MVKQSESLKHLNSLVSLTNEIKNKKKSFLVYSNTTTTISCLVFINDYCYSVNHSDYNDVTCKLIETFLLLQGSNQKNPDHVEKCPIW